jgi:CoA:oxalate CoA-transferase
LRFYACLEETLSTNSSAYWLQLLEAEDLPVAPVLSIDEHLSDPQVIHNRLFHEIDSPAGPVRVARYPAAFDGEVLIPSVPPPRPGEHDEEVFTAHLINREEK